MITKPFTYFLLTQILFWRFFARCPSLLTVFQTAIFNFLSQKSEKREGKENYEIALSPWSLDHDFIMFSQKNKVNMKFVIFMIRRKMISPGKLKSISTTLVIGGVSWMILLLWERYANSTYLKNHFPILTIYKGHSCVYV